MLWFSDTVYGRPTTQMRLGSETADHIAWSTYASPVSPSDTPSTTKTEATSRRNLRRALTRIHFSEAHTPAPVRTAIGHARAVQGTSSRLLIVAGRSRRLAQESHHAEMKHLLEASRSGIGPIALEGMRKTIGDVGTAMTVTIGGSASAVVVLQAAHGVCD